MALREFLKVLDCSFELRILATTFLQVETQTLKVCDVVSIQPEERSFSHYHISYLLILVPVLNSILEIFQEFLVKGEQLRKMLEDLFEILGLLKPIVQNLQQEAQYTVFY